jgi:choline kinase
MENNNMTLLILAAGMGSRFGGLKQIEPIGPNGEFIIDYSIYDAIKAGFNKVVFIIKEENYDIFRDTIGKRIEDKINVEYVFQKNDNIPSNYNYGDRVKPFGTAHAILCSKNNINENFIIINSDDFYGRDAFNVASNFLKTSKEGEYSLVGYNVKNTLTENGSVKRGVCEAENGYLTKIVESSVKAEGDKIVCSPLDGRDSFEVSGTDLVSMNMLGFTPNIFPYLDKKFIEFLDTNKDDLSSCEFLIPDVLQDSINEGYATCKVLSTTAKWEGVTYKEDKEGVVNAIRKLIEDGVYPQDLWK